MRISLPWVAFTAALLTCSGCAIVRQPFASRPAPIVQTVLVLDNAIHSLDTNSTDPKQILQRTLAALPLEGNDVSKRDLRDFLRRIPTPGVNFVCGVDFIRHRARMELERIKDTVLNTASQTPEPELCYSVPFVVDPAQKTGKESFLELYGYDFDRAPLEMVLVDTGNGFADVSSALMVRSHSHITVRLGAGGVQLFPNSRQLGLVWGHLIHHTIPIVQPSMSLCNSHIESIRPIAPLKYAPPQLNSATAVSSTTEVLANVELQPISNVLNAAMCLTVVSSDPVSSAFAGCANERLYSNESDFVVERVFGTAGSRISFAHRANQSLDFKNDHPEEPVAHWTFAGIDSSGQSRPSPEMGIQLNEIRVVLTDMEGCVSPIAYSEAKRMNALTRGVIERLDPQLTGTDPLITTVRPRFAPSVQR